MESKSVDDDQEGKLVLDSKSGEMLDPSVMSLHFNDVVELSEKFLVTDSKNEVDDLIALSQEHKSLSSLLTEDQSGVGVGSAAQTDKDQVTGSSLMFTFPMNLDPNDVFQPAETSNRQGEADIMSDIKMEVEETATTVKFVNSNLEKSDLSVAPDQFVWQNADTLFPQETDIQVFSSVSAQVCSPILARLTQDISDVIIELEKQGVELGWKNNSISLVGTLEQLTRCELLLRGLIGMSPQTCDKSVSCDILPVSRAARTHFAHLHPRQARLTRASVTPSSPTPHSPARKIKNKYIRNGHGRPRIKIKPEEPTSERSDMQTVEKTDGSLDEPEDIYPKIDLDVSKQLPSVEETKDNKENIDSIDSCLVTKRKHETHIPFKFYCEQCSFKTRRESHFQKHLQIHEKLSTLYKCQECSFTTIRLGHLRRHEMSHSLQMLKCSKCSYVTSKSKCLDRHTRIKHSGASESPLLCPLCGKPIPVNRGETPDIKVGQHIDSDCQSDPAKEKRKVFTNKCRVKGCRQKELMKVICPDCGNNYCLTHRHPQDHQCSPKTAADKAREAAMLRHQPTTQGSKFKFGIPRPTRNPAVNPRPTAAATSSVQAGLSEDEALARALQASLADQPVASKVEHSSTISQEQEDRMLAEAIAASEREARQQQRRHSSSERCVLA